MMERFLKACILSLLKEQTAKESLPQGSVLGPGPLNKVFGHFCSLSQHSSIIIVWPKIMEVAKNGQKSWNWPLLEGNPFYFFLFGTDLGGR